MHIRLRSLLLPLLLLIVVVLSVAPPLVPPAEAAACHTWQSACPEPKACTGWSSLVNCDSPFCDSHPACDSISGGVAVVQLKERFRDCTLSDGSHCIEGELYSFKVRCGC
jgi:hypothetical protein